MATSKAVVNTVNDVTVCSICFENFKIPRYLPCKHSFCHDCISSYIVSQCKSTEPRLGFHCPLCRVYIPCEGIPEKPEEWAELFPINEILQKIVNQPNRKLCEACLRDGDEEEALDFCLSCIEYLCKLCAKYHKKNLATRDHIIITVDEMKSKQVVPNANVLNRCPKHQHEKIQMYCHDHDQPCCGLCVGTAHRKCEKVETIENAVHFLRKSGQMDSLLNKVITFRKQMLSAKYEEEKNISEIESKVEEDVAKTEKLVKHIEDLKTQYVNELFSNLKKGKDKLQREIEKIEDGVLCVDNCKAKLEMAKETENNVEAIVKFVTAKKHFQEAKNLKLRQLHVTISADIKTPNWIELTELKAIANVKLAESSSFFDFDVRTLEFSKAKEIAIEYGRVYCGLFLSDGKVLIITYDANGACMLYDQNWECTPLISGLHNPYSAFQCEGEIFITQIDAKTIDVFSSANFLKLRSFQLNNHVYGITIWNENVYAACGNQILKLDKIGTTLKTYDLEGTYNIHITATTHGIIVYSDYISKVVTAMTDEGRPVWKYESDYLKHPRDLGVDSYDNIYIADTFSNSIHVLTESGEVIRVLKNFPSPYFFKIHEERRIACMCSEVNKICIYQF